MICLSKYITEPRNEQCSISLFAKVLSHVVASVNVKAKSLGVEVKK